MIVKRTEYIAGRNTRSESQSCCCVDGSALPEAMYDCGSTVAHIINNQISYRFELEPEKQIFTAVRLNCKRSTRIRKYAFDAPQAERVQVRFERETTDTGDRRNLFGYAAKRMIEKSRHTRDSELVSESESDGWYIDPPIAWLKMYPPPSPGTRTYLVSQADFGSDFQFGEKGAPNTLFALKRNHSGTYYNRAADGGSGAKSFTEYEEVSAISEAPLRADLFVPPTGCKRVPLLADASRYRLAYKLGLRWNMLADYLTLSRRIAQFRSSLS